jgi:hypothetical protein
MSKRERSTEVPVVEFRGRVPQEAFLEAFREGVCILRSLDAPAHRVSLEWLHSLYGKLTRDVESFTVENKAADNVGAAQFLSSAHPARGYCSFIVQKDRDALAELLEHHPYPQLPVEGLQYVDAVWVFVARNGSADETLAGRPPHTDSLQEDGTFHYQALGSKLWTLSSQHGSHVVTVQRGDLFVIDTKTWLHSTQIAPQAGEFSVSLARDFCLPGRRKPEEGADLTNVDGPYAVEPIEAGTILFRADECPDIELGRSTDPNCELVEIDDDLAIVSLRDIAPGEFFCIAPSSDEEGE